MNRGSGARRVLAPSGVEWRVGRRWVSRRVRVPRWRPGGGFDFGGRGAQQAAGFDSDPRVALVLLVGVVLVVFVVIPLVLFGVELIVLGAAIARASSAVWRSAGRG